jgi:hypothetical protein
MRGALTPNLCYVFMASCPVNYRVEFTLELPMHEAFFQRKELMTVFKITIRYVL